MENQQNYAEMNVSAEISTNFQGEFKILKRKKVRADCILSQFVKIFTQIWVRSAAADLVNSGFHTPMRTKHLAWRWLEHTRNKLSSHLG